jgi:hypothetical protein
VLIIGGLITLSYPAFFGTTNLLAQILMTAALAELVALAMLLGLAFDYPFTGEVRISASPFDHALRLPLRSRAAANAAELASALSGHDARLFRSRLYTDMEAGKMTGQEQRQPGARHPLMEEVL